MSMREEVQKIIEEADVETITAELVVEAAKDAKKYPGLYRHLWEVPEPDLAMEARVMRAHKLIYTINITSGEGETTRLLVHTRGIPGYKPIGSIVGNRDLAALKLQQLTEDIGRARARLRGFRAAIPDAVADEVDDLLAKAEAKASGAKEEVTEAA